MRLSVVSVWTLEMVSPHCWGLRIFQTNVSDLSSSLPFCLELGAEFQFAHSGPPPAQGRFPRWLVQSSPLLPRSSLRSGSPFITDESLQVSPSNALSSVPLLVPSCDFAVWGATTPAERAGSPHRTTRLLPRVSPVTPASLHFIHSNF